MSDPNRSKLSRRKFLLRTSLGLAAARAGMPLLQASAGQPAPSPTAPRPAAAPRGSLIIAMSEALLATLDPQMHNNVPNYGVLTHTYDKLVERDQETKEIKPHLAESWRALDEKTWEFKLRRGARFHNGEPFNAQSVKYTIERLVDPDRKTLRGPLWRSLDKVEIKDDYTVLVKTKTPSALVLPLLLMEEMLPPQETAKLGKDSITKPVGTGPYRFVEWKKDSHIALEANPEYWGKPPTLAKITIRFIGEPAARLTAVEAGDVHIVDQVPVDQLERLRGIKNLSLPAVPTTMTGWIPIYCGGTGPTSKVKVREAICTAINREVYLQSILKGIADPTPAILSPAVWGSAKVGEWPKYDVNRAKQLLAEAGYANGFDLSILTTPGIVPMYAQVVEALQADMKKVGINATAEILEMGVYMQRRGSAVGQRNFGMFYQGFTSMNMDPAMIINAMLDSAISRNDYNNPKVDEALRKADQSVDEKERLRWLTEAQRIAWPEYPHAWTFGVTDYYAMRSDKVAVFTPRRDRFYEVRWAEVKG